MEYEGGFLDNHGFQNQYPENQPISRWRNFVFRLKYFLQNMSKRTLAVYLLVFLLAIGGVFLITKQIFKADELRAFTVSGTLYGQDTKKILAEADISLSSSTYTEAAPITVKTNASGFYQISAPDATFINITIIKDGYWDINGVISNYDDSGQFTLNLNLKPGFGSEDAQIIATSNTKHLTNFGISLEPFDTSPASLTEVIPNGDTYTESSILTKIPTRTSFFDQKTGGWATYDPNQTNIILFRGQVISYNTTSAPSTFVIRGRAKTEPVAISAQANKSVYMANPYMYPIKLSDFVIKRGDNEADLVTATSRDTIKNNLELFAASGSKTININSDEYLDISLAPGDAISIGCQEETFSLTPSHPIVLKGKVTSADNTSLSDAKIIFVSNDPNFDQSVEATTGADGSYTLAANDISYNQALITKDGYQDTYIHLQNGGKIADISADIALEPGFGNTQIEMIPVRSGITTTFGLPFSPDNKFAIQTTAPAGNNDKIKSFELNQGEFVPIESDKFSVAEAGQIDQQLSKSTAVYDSNNDIIYHFGGIDQADSKPSTAIYAYSPGTTVSQYVNDLPVPLYNAGSIFIPDRNLILIFGGQDAKVYGYYPETNKVFTLDDISEADQFLAISDGANIYVFGESAGNTKIYKVSYSDIAANLESKNCYPAVAADCALDLFTSPTSISPPIGFAPYYSSTNSRIYFFGGKSGDQLTADIYSVNSDLTDFRKETVALPFAVADTAYFSDTSTNKAYLFGGNVAGGTTDKGTVISINNTGAITASNLPNNFKLTNATSSVAFAPDGQNNFFIFSSTAGLADPPPATPSYIQAIYPTATYKAGQVYSITPTSDYSLLVRSTEKPISEQNSISMSDAPDPSNYFVINKPGNPYYFSTSTNDPESLYKYKITKVDDGDNVNEYNLIDAAKNGLIEHTVKINDRSIDVTALSTKDLKSTYVYPSDIFSFTDKADSTFSKDGDQINPDFDNGYQFIPKAIQALTDAGMNDDEISNVMAQLDDCDPISFYDINATDDQRNACIDSIQVPGDTSPVSMEKSKSILSKLIPTALAMNTSDAKRILKEKKINPNQIPLAILREYIKMANNYSGDSSMSPWDRYLGTTPEDNFRKIIGGYKNEIYNHWMNYLKGVYGHSDYCNYDRVNPIISGVTPFITKELWSSGHLDSLYKYFLPNLSQNRHRTPNQFTSQEKKYLMAVWNGGGKDLCNNLPAQGDTRNWRQQLQYPEGFIEWVNLGLVMTGFTAGDTTGVFLTQVGTIAKAKYLTFVGKSVKVPAITSVSSKVFAESTQVWGTATSELEITGKFKPPNLDLRTTKAYKIPNIARLAGYADDTAVIDFTAMPAVKTSMSTLNQAKRITGYTKVLLEWVTQSRYWPSIVEANGGDEALAAKNFRILLQKMVVEEDPGTGLEGHVIRSELKMGFPYNIAFTTNEKDALAQRILHEICHTLPKNDIGYLLKYRVTMNGMSYSFFDEMFADAASRNMTYELTGKVGHESLYFYEKEIWKTMVETLSKMQGTSESQASEALTKKMTELGIDGGMNYYFNSAAKTKLGQEMTSHGVNNFHDLLWSEAKNIQYDRGGPLVVDQQLTRRSYQNVSNLIKFLAE